MNIVSLQWRRTSVKGGLELWVNESERKEGDTYAPVWVHYKKSKYYKPDLPKEVSTQSGFTTFQNYLQLSKKGLFNLNILKVSPEDNKDIE